MCVRVVRSVFKMVGHADGSYRLGASATTAGGAAFLPGIYRLIGVRTSPGRPRSSAKFTGTEWDIDKIVAAVDGGTGASTAFQHVPGGGGAPALGSVTSGTVPADGNTWRKGRRVVPGTIEWS